MRTENWIITIKADGICACTISKLNYWLTLCLWRINAKKIRILFECMQACVCVCRCEQRNVWYSLIKHSTGNPWIRNCTRSCTRTRSALARLRASTGWISALLYTTCDATVGSELSISVRVRIGRGWYCSPAGLERVRKTLPVTYALLYKFIKYWTIEQKCWDRLP